MKNSLLIHDMIRICPQTGEVLEEQARHKSVSELQAGSLTLVSPRNGYVSFQVIIRLKDAAASNIHITAEALKGELSEISAAEYSLYAQWYHLVKNRYYPDALVPLTEAGSPVRTLASVTEQNAVPEQEYSAVWIDLFIPSDILPGEYQGTVRVQVGNSTDIHSFGIKVLETTVPNESLLIADLNSYADNLSIRMDYLRDNENRYQDGTYFKVEQQFFRMAHEHRCLFHYLPYEHSGKVPPTFVPEIEGKGRFMHVKDWSQFDEHYGPYLDGSAFEGTKRGPIPLPYLYLPFNFHWPADYVKFGTKGYQTEFATIFKEFYEHFTERGWLQTKFELFLNHKKRYKLFPYDGDETRFVWDEKVNDIYYEMVNEVLENKDGAQFIFRTDSSWSYGLHFEKYADMIRLWVVNGQIFSWFPESVKVLREAGNEIWTYGGTQNINRTLLGTVISPLTAVARGVDGFCFWENTKWGDRWHETPDDDGQTTLFYPGDRLFGILGPIPSLRLKILRNSMQIADCMEQWIRQQPDARRSQISQLIVDSLGIEPGAWWPGKPDFLDTPPYEWADAMLSDAPRASLHTDQPPEAFNDLKIKLWDTLG
jgi:hypothetical protein